MSTIIIITPPPKDPPTRSGEPDGMAIQSAGQARSDYAILRQLVDDAERQGARLQFVQTP